MIKLENVCKAYRGHKVLDNLSLEIATGDLVGIMGRSGCGKSTLLHILGFLEAHDSGAYYYNQKNINTLQGKDFDLLRRDSIGFVFQNHALIHNKTAFYNISVPLICKRLNKIAIKEMVSKIAEQLGIEHLLQKYPYELSGGECQRVAIARAIVRNPDIILADEPTGSLDLENEEMVLEIFKKLNQMNKTIIIVTHDHSVTAICEKKLILSNGMIS